MRIKRLNDVPATEPPGYVGVIKQIVIGAEDGSEEIVLRRFSLSAGGKTPYHSHNFPHLVRLKPVRVLP